MVLRGSLLLGLLIAFCRCQDEEDPCLEKFETGPCKGEKHVVKFDTASGSCVPAVYGGCRGTRNNFKGITECEETCEQHLKVRFSVASPSCSAPPLKSRKSCFGFFPRFTYNVDNGACEPYMYGGCNGSDNLYLTEEECIKTCIKADITVPASWSRAGDLDESKINFPDESEESSEVSSSGRSGDLDSDEEGDNDDDDDDDDEDICSLPPIYPGPMGCLAFVPKWTYSKSEGKCVDYVYGGCRGTPNLFDTQDECRAACQAGGREADQNAEVCRLPIIEGPCRGLRKSFGFNSATGRCEPFNYGGCKGNTNRFRDESSCVSVCGGATPPARDLDCVNVECDLREMSLQRSKGCLPVTRPDECCPSSWDCSVWKKRLDAKSQCFVVSKEFPAGKFYDSGDSIDMGEDDGCMQACYCEGGIEGSTEARVVCAAVDCFHPRDTDFDSCVPQYRSISSCCASDYLCDDKRDKLGKCVVDGVTYRHGEKMYPKKDPCLVCLCQKGWDGLLKEPQCTQADCGFARSDKLLRGCQPLYRDDVCCPVDWVCPGDERIPPLPPALDQSAGFITSRDSALKSQDRCLVPAAATCDDSDLTFRYFFDKGSGSCQKGEGCPTEVNNFETEAECNKVCADFLSGAPAAPSATDKRVFRPKVPKCAEQVKVGRCRSRLKKFHYDVTTGKCHEFFYSGCQGGPNMFDDLRECVITCVPPSAMLRGRRPVPRNVDPNPCVLDVSVGPCRAMKPRFFFNRQSGNCESFVYSGCQGNANNFQTLNSCLEKCRPGGSGPSIQVDGGASTLPGQVSGGPPAPPVLGGPSGGLPGGLFPGQIDADAKKVAALASKQLAGVGAVSRACNHAQLLTIVDVRKQVVAGTNYFFTLRMRTKTGPDCSVVEERTCSNVVAFKPLPFACQATPDNPLCIEIIRQDEIRCVEGSDAPPAPSAVDPAMPPLLGAPPPPPSARNINGAFAEEDPCLEEKVIGRCKAAIRRFYFDQAEGKCKQFIYGGCKGNGNNFVNEDECNKQCGHLLASNGPQGRTALNTGVIRANPQRQICNKPMDGGRCFALQPRFYYNPASRRCESFMFGGCGGNENNFETIQECISACGKHLRGPALPPPEPKCKFGDVEYSVGDVVRLGDDPCKSCICSSPPDLSCSVTKCPLILMSPWGGDCKPKYDDLGCCTVGYECTGMEPPAPEPELLTPTPDLTPAPLPDLSTEPPLTLAPFIRPVAPIAPVPPGFAGGFSSSRLTPTIKKVAARATKKLLNKVTKVTGALCEDLTLMEIIEAHTQVVAGTNYVFSLHLRAKTGPTCKEDLPRFCKNVVIHKPLAFACAPDMRPMLVMGADGKFEEKPSEADDMCLELIREDEMECFETRDELPPPDLAGPPSPGGLIPPPPGGFARLPPPLPPGAVALVTAERRNADEIIQCQQNGLSACYKLEFDIAALEAMKVDDEIIFADIDPFTIKLRQPPTSGGSSRNYQFLSTDTNLGASFSIKKLQGGGVSIYGSARTNDRIYAIESAGNGVNVIYWRPADYFNNFEE